MDVGVSHAEAVIFTCPVVTRRCFTTKSSHVGSAGSRSCGSVEELLVVELLIFLAAVKLASYCRFQRLVVRKKLPDSVLGLHLRQSVSQLLIRIDPSQHGLLALHVLHQMQKLQS